MIKYLFIVFVCVLNSCYAGNLAPFITPCHSSDRQCLVTSAQRALPVLAGGVPALGVGLMDPMHVDRVTAHEAGLNLDFKNTQVKGLKKCTILDVKRKGPKTWLELKCSVTLNGDYNLKGKLLTFNIEGDGTYKIKITDMVIKIQFDLEERTQGGEKHWEIRNLHQTSQVLTNAQFQFNNLFNGNEALSKVIHAAANSDWNAIYKDVAPPVVRAIVDHIAGELQKLFHAVPVSQLALD